MALIDNMNHIPTSFLQGISDEPPVALPREPLCADKYRISFKPGLFQPIQAADKSLCQDIRLVPTFPEPSKLLSKR
jgi:hypothetical protein